MSESNVSEMLAEIQRKKAEADAKKAATAVQAEELGSDVLDTAPQRPPHCSAEDWAKMPPDVQAVVAMAGANQAAPINPPEIAQGLVESATGKPLETPAQTSAEEKPKRGRKLKAETTAIDLGSVIAELKRLRESKDVVEAIDRNTVALKELASAILGAAQIMMGL